jgi:hypothetical protein
MRYILLASCLLLISTQTSLAAQSVGQRWEQALLTAKKNGTLPARGLDRNACGPSRLARASGTRPRIGICASISGGPNLLLRERQESLYFSTLCSTFVLRSNSNWPKAENHAMVLVSSGIV